MSSAGEPKTGEFDPRAIALSGLGARAPEAPLKVEVGALTHPGLVRANNEDHFIVARLARCFSVVATNLPEGKIPGRHEESAYALAVADGMGGAAAGEVASTLALTLGTEMTIDDGKWPLRLDEQELAALTRRVGTYFSTIDQIVSERAKTLPGLAGMGTTLTVVYSVGRDLVTFHVGDSRAYLFRQGRLRQLTRDQTVAQALVDAGQLRTEEAAVHRLRHVLTHAIGSGENAARAVTHHERVEPGDRLLMCSDGLTDMVGDEAIADVLGRALPAQQACEVLVAAALEAGGRDNVTAIVADYAGPAQATGGVGGGVGVRS
jgi:serine/threonine protein phosphatase PrpC